MLQGQMIIISNLSEKYKISVKSGDRKIKNKTQIIAHIVPMLNGCSLM